MPASSCQLALSRWCVLSNSSHVFAAVWALQYRTQRAWYVLLQSFLTNTSGVTVGYSTADLVVMMILCSFDQSGSPKGTRQPCNLQRLKRGIEHGAIACCLSSASRLHLRRLGTTGTECWCTSDAAFTQSSLKLLRVTDQRTA
jgi:hypothetical protein